MARRLPALPDAPPRSEAQARASSPGERHSGEGAASALALLQALQKRRDVDRPADLIPPDATEPSRPNS